MVGGRSREPRPQYCRPGKPAIANHQTRHEVHNQVSRRRGMLLMQGTEVPEHRRGYLQKKNRLLGRRHHEKKQDDPTRKNQHQEHRSQKHQPSKTSDSHQQAKPSATRAFFVWPDIPPTWELESDVRRHSETKPNFSRWKLPTSPSGFLQFLSCLEQRLSPRKNERWRGR